MLKSFSNPLGWSIRHDIPVETDHCRKCGKVVKIDRPVISKDFVGFESDVHECGEAYVISLLKPRSPDLVKMMNGAVY